MPPAPLRCASCQFENPAGTRFCGRCGTPLAAKCPSCGADAPADFKFCGHCGASLSMTTSPGAGAVAGAASPGGTADIRGREEAKLPPDEDRKAPEAELRATFAAWNRVAAVHETLERLRRG